MKHTDLMEFGKFKGEMMGKIPAWYLLWLYENVKGRSPYVTSLKEYIVNNMEDLMSELEHNESQRIPYAKPYNNHMDKPKQKPDKTQIEPKQSSLRNDDNIPW